MPDVPYPNLQSALPDLADDLQGNPTFDALKDLVPLQCRARTDVFAAELDGQRVVVKRWQHAKRRLWARRAAQELERVTPVMGQSVGSLIASEIDFGILVMSHLPGTPLPMLLAESDAARRAGLITQALDWLKRYCDIAEPIEGGFAPNYWITALEAEDITTLEMNEQRLIKKGIRALRQVGKALRGLDGTRHLGPSDFAAYNLVFDPIQGIGGFDLERPRRTPAMRQVASLLATVAIETLPNPVSRKGGIDTDMRTAAQHHPILAEGDTRVLQFFIVELLIRRLLSDHINPVRRDTLRAQIKEALSALTS